MQGEKMRFKILFSLLLTGVFLSGPVFAEDIPFPKVIMLVTGSYSSLFIEGQKYELKYLSGNRATGEFCLADALGDSQCFKMKENKGDGTDFYNFCFSTGGCLKFKVVEFNEKYINIRTTTFQN